MTVSARKARCFKMLAVWCMTVTHRKRRSVMFHRKQVTSQAFPAPGIAS